MAGPAVPIPLSRRSGHSSFSWVDGASGVSHGPNGKPAKSAFVTGTWVIYKERNGRRVRGQVVGPDQDYFPSPLSVFVSFPSTGFVQLLNVENLELAEVRLTGQQQ